jgi:arginyl-tRNA synthetase
MIKNEAPPEGGYSSDYVRELADWLIANQPEVARGTDDAELARAAVTRMLDGVPGSKVLPGIKRTLADLRIFHDSWYSEESLHRWGRVAAALGELEKKGYMEEREGALFFKSTEEGDDKDRVVRKKDGDYTYFASDIAYHADKVRRGYDRLITVLGADHHGYTARVRGALAALGLPKEKYEVLLFQLVSLLRDGVPYRMGKRLGNFITIEEVVEEIDEAAKRKGAGADALRYFYLARRTETPIELDIEIAKKATLENPVFYLQYGYARLGSILRRAKEVFGLDVPAATPALIAKLVHPKELQILGTLGRFPALVREAAEGREPHRIITYLNELSQDFQSYFTHLKTQGDAILPQAATTSVEGWEKNWDKDKTRARLVWIDAIRVVYASGLAIAGISAPERMERLAAAPSPESKAAAPAEEEEDA